MLCQERYDFAGHTEETLLAKAIREERPREVEEVKKNLLARLEHEGPLKGLGNVGLYSNNRKGKEMSFSV